LLLGGPRARRLRIARAFHLHGQVRHRPFVRLQCGRAEGRLREALQRWCWPVSYGSPPHPLRGVEDGTLFLDALDKVRVVLRPTLAPRPGRRSRPSFS
jgi:hypothetical protein